MVHVIIGKHILAVLFGSRLINGILVNFLLLCAISLIQQRASIKGTGAANDELRRLY